MKILKKIAALLLAVCLAVPCFATLTYAAGSIQFTDPSTKTGEVLEVTCAIKAGEVVEDATVVLAYDANMLKFKSGDNVTESASGQLTYKVKAAGQDTIRFKMNFDVLKEGTTKIEVAGGTVVYNTADQKIDLQNGFSTITIEAGETPVEEPEEPEEPAEDPDTTMPSVTDEHVTVNGRAYTLSGEFAEADIPEGFEETTMEYNGAQVKVVQQASSGISLGYLVDENLVGKFFLYNAEDATFSPFEQIIISDATVITLLTDTTNINLPKEYQKVTLTLNEQSFQVWQNVENLDYYVLYAMNNNGEKSLYQFDSVEGTYQRFEVPAVEEEVKIDHTLFGKLNRFLEKHLDYVILGTGLGLIFFVVLIVVLSVKLYNRNAELDELYDEYDIDLDEEEEEPEKQAKEEKKGLFRKKEEPEDDDFDDDSFLGDDDFLDEDDEDDFIEDDDEEFFDDGEDFVGDDDDDILGKDEEEANEEDDNDAELLEESDFSYDDFDVDFIDLDD